MSIFVQDERMAKKTRGGPRDGAGRPKSERNDIAVKIDKSIATMAKAIANRRGSTLAEVLSDLSRPVVERAYRQMLQELDDLIQ